MSAVSMKIDGLKSLERELKRLDVKVRKNILRRALTAAANPIVKEAKLLAPKDSGMLRKSITKKVSGARASNNYTAAVDIGIRGRAFYGTFVELGTSTVRKQPFLRPAMDSKKNEAIAAFKKKIAEGIKRGK